MRSLSLIYGTHCLQRANPGRIVVHGDLGRNAREITEVVFRVRGPSPGPALLHHTLEPPHALIIAHRMDLGQNGVVAILFAPVHG